MWPNVYKKKAELRGVLDYLENRITGDELVGIVNNEVMIGNKVGKVKISSLPFTRSHGKRLSYEYSLERAHAAVRVFVPEDKVEKIRNEHYASKVSIKKLAKSYGYSKSVIERVLGKPY